jgi:hypothetical protein
VTKTVLPTKRFSWKQLTFFAFSKVSTTIPFLRLQSGLKLFSEKPLGTLVKFSGLAVYPNLMGQAHCEWHKSIVFPTYYLRYIQMISQAPKSKAPLMAMSNSLIVGALLACQTFAFIPAMAADNEIRVAGQSIFSVPAAGGMTADKRAQIIQQNLDNALVAAKDKGPAAVNITYVKGIPVITMGGYQVVTVDSTSAKGLNTSPALLAKRWADSLRESLKDQASIQSYVAQLSGDYASSAPAPTTNAAPQPNYGNTSYNPPQNTQPQPNNYGQSGYQQPMSYQGQMQRYGQPPQQQQQQPNYGGTPSYQGRVTFAPTGLIIPITLSSGISTTVAKPGDIVQAAVSQTIMLGDSAIPVGSVIMGTITDAQAGKMLGRTGELGIKFNRLRTPDGIETPISAHLVGGIGKYTGSADVVKGETWKTKALQAGVRGAIGAGTGAALGTAVGAIAGGGRGVGKGAWSGTAIGAGAGVAQSLLLRKGTDINVAAGTAMQIQLDAPVSIAGGQPANTYNNYNY